MHSNIQGGKLLIISDTSVCKVGNEYHGFEPVVREIEYFLTVFDSIEWIAYYDDFLLEQKAHCKIDSKRVSVSLFPAIGGKTILKKIQILSSYPKMYNLIKERIQNYKHIHVRGPSHPAILTSLYCYLSRKKNTKIWFKYAGSWIDPAPLYYSIQRVLLRNLPSQYIITINGEFEKRKDNILNFQNPCLTENDRIESLKLLNQKVEGLSKSKFLFVGNLNEHKGVDLIIEAFSNSNSMIELIGGGPKLDFYRKRASRSLNVSFLGQKQKDEVHVYYKEALALILPSKSEGFPKVVSEAMNFGCIPIVSDVSCVSEIITHKGNGYLLKKLDKEEVEKSIEWVNSLSDSEVKKILEINIRMSEMFTYEYYLKRIMDEIY